jgi:hypothetical protein
LIPPLSKYDGYVKRLFSALRFIPCPCDVKEKRFIPWDVHALIPAFFRNRLKLVSYQFSIWMVSSGAMVANGFSCTEKNKDKSV